MSSPNSGRLDGIYDPAKISVWVAGLLMSGFGEEMVRVTYANQEFNFEIGIDGEVVRWPTNDYSGEISITLLPTSLSNGILQSLILADRVTGSNTFALIIKDVSNLLADTITAPLCWIKTNPTVIYRKGIELRVWTITCAYIYPILTGYQISN